MAVVNGTITSNPRGGAQTPPPAAEELRLLRFYRASGMRKGEIARAMGRCPSWVQKWWGS